MERYRRGKAWRAKTGSVNVLGGAPFGYRYVRKTPESGARYEIIDCEAVLVTEMFRRYELPRVFRTGNPVTIYAAACISSSSSMTSCGVLYPSVE